VPNVSLGKFGRTITEFVGTEIMGAIAGVLDMIIGDQMSSGMAKLPGFARKMVSFYTELTTLNDLPYVSFGRFSSLIGSVIAVDFTGLFTAIGDEVVAGISGESGKGMMDTFTEDLSALATAITDWAATMETLKGVTIDTTPINDAISAVTSANETGLISGLTSAIANFFTDDDMTNIQRFGQDINDLGSALQSFQDQFGDVKVDIDNAGIESLTAALNKIKDVEGGGLFGAMADLFTGSVEENIEKFKTQMPKLGEAITAFNDSLGENLNVANLASASEALSYLGQFAESASYGFQTSGGFDYLFNYVRGLADTVAPNLNDFVTKIEDMSGLATLSASLEQLSTGMQTLSTLELDTGDIYDGTIVDTMTTNVETLKSMITSLAGIDTSGVDKIVSATNSLNGIDISKTQDSISKAKAGKAGSDSGKELASGMANAISSDTSVSTAMSTVASGGAAAAKSQSGAYTSAGTSLMVALASAITSNRDLIKTAMSTAANRAVEAVKSHKGDMKSLGGDFARGFASGITENTSFVVSAARAMVERAKNAAKNAQDSNSPSRDTYKFGRWFVQGYKNAIHDYKKEPADEARSMTQGTVTALGEALTAVSDMLDTDDEFQPTITPILDLSDVESKASGISTLLDTSPTIGANLGAVSTNMSAMKQRTSMTDLLEAMEDLGSVMGSAHPINNYNVNGVTYDDGTNVASAVGDLVRAVNIERRA
jgi:ABC-type transporter MlaC component